MKNITWDMVRENYAKNPICKKGLTPFILITNGVVTYQDWFKALQYSPDAEDDKYGDDNHRTYNTTFGKKLMAFAEAMGYCGYCFSWKFKKRTANCELESIKLINISISLIFEMEENDVK